MFEALERTAISKLQDLEEAALRRELAVTERQQDAVVLRNGQRMVSFSCNDYLNLSTHPAIVAAAVAATQKYGAGAGASRAVTGNHPLYAELESRLAALKGTEAAVVFGSGYLANVGIISALMGRKDLILLDELSHSCIWTGARLSGADYLTFPHNDAVALREILETQRGSCRECLIVTETVFSMDGDVAPVAEIVAMAEEHKAWVLTDDAHGLGVVKIPGSEHVPLQMGTLSKAIGGYGGYLCASANVVALIRNRARSFVYTTGLPPGTIAAAIASLDFIAANPEYSARPLAKAQRFTSTMGLPDATSPIVPVIIGEAWDALAASQKLQQAGFLAAAIRPPTVPAGTARLRLTFTAQHTDEDIDKLAELLKEAALF